MQTNRNNRSRPAQSPYVPTGRRPRAAASNGLPSIALLAALCVVLPPVGIMLLWRAERVSLPVRIGFSALGFAAMLLIFCWFMRPGDPSMDILPIPQTPKYAGYGQIGSVSAPVAPPVPEAPAQPAAPAAPDEGYIPPESDPDELTDESIVFAVTNNASSFHVYEICDQQENHRAMTLREALNEGLVPCEKCVGAAG